MTEDAPTIAAEFWRLAGGAPRSPRDLEASVLWTLPLAVVKLPRLGTDAVREWLAAADLQSLMPPGRRQLRACIVASRGKGFVFIDGTDPEAEQRYSLAHETAHFLLDYFLPRRAAVQALGPSILPVLDGDRTPSPEERLSAVLRGVRLGVYTRLWQRGPRGISDDLEAVAREDAVDALALELLAPRAEVVRAAKAAGWDAASLAGVLESRFGLPQPCAAAFANRACIATRPVPSVRQWLGIKDS